jgi:hypothetical protein
MIETDKYEGHEYERMHIERWHLPDTPEEVMIANAFLMDDAPFILEAYKRLCHELLLILSDFQTKKTDMYEMRNRIETILKGEKEMIK